jgi:hypothetical protein
MTKSLLFKAASVASASALMLVMNVGVASAQDNINCPVQDAIVVNVTQVVKNDADSGQAGNYWAFDTYQRSIKMFDNHNGTYCAEVRYTGAANAVAGQRSPGNTGFLNGHEDAVMRGGYQATITGSLLATPTWKKSGNVGTFNYACDLSGNCPGKVDWVAQYFGPSYGFNFDWWGWTYQASHGTWVNAITGNTGDVI